MPIDEQILDSLLCHVQKPGRYIGREVNSIIRDPQEAECHMCLMYPDIYELGMSNTGIRVLYQLVNDYPGCYMERSYCPWPDMKAQMEAHNIPLYSMETHTPLKEFDCVGVTLQTELAYSNLPYIFELAGIPVFAKDRGDEDPLILAGGPTMANPEPVAEFFDFFVIGDGEVMLPPILDLLKKAKRESWSRDQKLQALHALKGVYVPLLTETFENEYGEVIPKPALREHKHERVARQWVENVTNDNYLGPQIIPNVEPTHSRVGVEVMRGCTQGCRFCQAGYWDRPARELEPSAVMSAVEKGMQSSGLNEVGLLSLSTADYSKLSELVGQTKNEFLGKEKPVKVSLPSLRADRFTAQMAVDMDDVRGASLTFAPETGSERLRQFINKNITNEQMFEAAQVAYRNGWDNIKMYFMIGIPSETWEDIESIVWLTREILKIGRKISRRKTISANIGILSPKPWTAMQWDACNQPEEIEKKLTYLQKEFHRLGRFSTHSLPNYTIESSLSRGDRRMAKVIYSAYQMGACYDCWDEHFNFEIWQKAFEQHGIDPHASQRARHFDEPLPWDIIEPGVKKAYLRAERKRADKLAFVPDCKWGDCQYCGIPGNGEDIKLAGVGSSAGSGGDPGSRSGMTVGGSEVTSGGSGMTVGGSEVTVEESGVTSGGSGMTVGGSEVTVEESGMTSGESRMTDNVTSGAGPLKKYIYRITFSKRGFGKYLSHRDCLTHFEIAFRRSGIAVKYTEGFNKRMRITAGPALPLGYESDVECLEVQLLEMPSVDWAEQLQGFLPYGLAITECTLLSEDNFSLQKFNAVCRYEVRLDPDVANRIGLEQKLETLKEDDLKIAKEVKGKQHFFDASDWVKAAKQDQDDPHRLNIDLWYEHGQRNLTLKDLLTAHFELSTQDMELCPTKKVELIPAG